MSDESVKLLRAALGDAPASDDDWAARVAQASLITHAMTIPEHRAVVEEWRREGRAELDLHVDGRRIEDHEGPARGVGELLRRSSAAVNELAKQVVGKQRRRETLRVAALAPGSLRVVLRAPSLPAAAHRTDVLPDSQSETAEEAALRMLSAIMLQAAEGEAEVAASLATLRGKPRRAVRQVAQVLLDNGWSVEGQLKLRDHAPLDVRLTTEAAGRIVDAARETDEDVISEKLSGVLDGWIWSAGTMFLLKDGGQRIPVAVPPELQSDVARLNAEQASITGKFRVLLTRPPGDRTTESRSYALESLVETSLDVPLPIPPVRRKQKPRAMEGPVRRPRPRKKAPPNN